MATISFYTAVQHSGYGYGGDPTFQLGLESRHISTAKERDLVLHQGGVLFGSYAAAERYCMEEMYRNEPEGAFSLVPHAPGEFSTKQIDGLAIYRPQEKPAEAVR